MGIPAADVGPRSFGGTGMSGRKTKDESGNGGGETGGKTGLGASTWIGTTNQGKLQRRAPTRNAWTTARRRRFLEMLAATANVAMSARAMGTSAGNVRSLRYRDAEFARLWDRAIEVARDRLEEELLARALGQVPDDANPAEIDLDAPAPAPFDVDLALKLMAMNKGRVRASAEGRMAPATRGEVDAALMQRLVDMGRRLANAPDAAGQAAADIRLIASARAAMLILTAPGGTEDAEAAEGGAAEPGPAAASLRPVGGAA